MYTFVLSVGYVLFPVCLIKLLLLEMAVLSKTLKTDGFEAF